MRKKNKLRICDELQHVSVIVRTSKLHPKQAERRE